MQTAKESAIQDIQDALKQDSRCFIAFRKELNPIMDKLVNNYIKHQEDKQ